MHIAVQIIIMLLAFAVLLYGFTRADRLVRAEYECHRDAWLQDGSPAGFFWWPPNFRRRCPMKWLFRTPPWVAASPDYRRILRTYRACVLLSDMLIVALVLWIFVFSR
jgi:hypothetical protein